MNEEIKPHLRLNESKKVFEAENLPALMQKCQPLQEAFTQKCPAEWQQHFDKIWNAEIYNLLSKTESWNLFYDALINLWPTNQTSK